MKAKKYIEMIKVSEDGKDYELLKREVKEVAITENDWDFLYGQICNDDWECAQDHGLYSYDDGFSYLNCSKFGEYMEDWKQDRIDDGEWDEYIDTFKEQFERLFKILEENRDWDIWFEENKEVKTCNN